MKENIMKYLECPLCHGLLKWEVEKQVGSDIIDGRAMCSLCNNIYPVENEIAIFLNPKIQDRKIWNKSDRTIRKKNIKSKIKIDNFAVNENISPKEILNEISLIDNWDVNLSAELYQLYMEKIGMESTFNLLKILSQKCVERIGKDEIVLDFASGKCILAERILESKVRDIIINDINPIILERSKKEMKKRQDISAASFIAFDIKKSPFKPKSINTATTLFGLQNIIPCAGVLEEINRISKRMLCINSFLNENKKENLKILKRYNIEEVWIKETFERKIDRMGGIRDEICYFYDLAKGANDDENKTRFAVMKFPIQETIMEYNLTEVILS